MGPGVEAKPLHYILVGDAGDLRFDHLHMDTGMPGLLYFLVQPIQGLSGILHAAEACHEVAHIVNADHWLSIDLVVAGQAEVSSPIKARYIKVQVKGIGLCPPWHYGVGYPAWFFMDEVVVY
jgi:hypothetical protein